MEQKNIEDFVYETQWKLPELDRTLTLCTDSRNQDTYSEFVRTKFKLTAECRLALNLLDQECSVIDIGASIGVFSLPLALKLNANVLAVEAHPDNAYLLRRASQKNGLLGKYHVVNAAAGNTEAIVRIRNNSAYGTVGNVGIPIQQTTLDKILDQYSQFRHTDFVKIDVEGMELEALEGMKTFLAHYPAVEVLYEVNLAHLYSKGRTHNELLSYFEERGFSNYIVIDKYLIPRRSTDFIELGVANVLATKKAPGTLKKLPYTLGEIPTQLRSKFLYRTLHEMKPGYGNYVRQHKHMIPKSIITHDMGVF